MLKVKFGDDPLFIPSPQNDKFRSKIYVVRSDIFPKKKMTFATWYSPVPVCTYIYVMLPTTKTWRFATLLSHCLRSSCNLNPFKTTCSKFFILFAKDFIFFSWVPFFVLYEKEWFRRIIWDALRDSVPFVRFEKHKQHQWRIVTLSKVAGFNFTESNTPPWVFFTFFKLRK